MLRAYSVFRHRAVNTRFRISFFLLFWTSNFKIPLFAVSTVCFSPVLKLSLTHLLANQASFASAIASM